MSEEAVAVNRERQVVAVVFSKDRALQLDACLTSLCLNCRDLGMLEVRVLFKFSGRRHERQYRDLEKQYDFAHFLQEQSFQEDLLKMIDGFFFVLFIVDDTVFIRPWGMKDVLKVLDRNLRSIGFSLRLGRNTTYCYPFGSAQELPAFQVVGQNMLKFEWLTAKYDFGYPLEVSSSVYRLAEIRPLLDQLPGGSNPNGLEALLAGNRERFAKSHPELLCYDRSVAFSVPANIVQTESLNRNAGRVNQSSRRLSRKFDLGFRIDVSALQSFVPNACHQEVEYAFTAPNCKEISIESSLRLESAEECRKRRATDKAGKTDSRRRFECAVEISELEPDDAELILNFLGILTKGNQIRKQSPWLLEVLRGLDQENTEDILDECEKINDCKERLREARENCGKLESECQELKRNLVFAHKKIADLERKLPQSLESSEAKLEQAAGRARNSAPGLCLTFSKLAKDARQSRRSAVLLPARIVAPFLSVKLKALLKDLWAWFRYAVIEKSPLGRRLFRKLEKAVPPLVSVVIPCYNYGQYLEEAVDSVLTQTWRDFEIIIVNDGSDDPDTIRVLRQLRRPRTKIICQVNMKLPAARNRGISEARGRYICCLDADDKMAPTYLEKCVQRMIKNDLDICGSFQQNFGDNDAVLSPGVFSLQILLEHNCMINAALFSRDLWKAVGGYDETMTDGYEDWEFWIRMAAAGAKAGLIPEPLFLYRKHGRSMIDSTLEKHDRIVEIMMSKHGVLIEKGKQRAVQLATGGTSPEAGPEGAV